MFSPLVIFGVCCLYMAFLFVIALWVERKAATGRNIGNNPVIYALSLTVYLTTWTYYGSVGKAASTGMLFLTVYLGPTLAMLLWWAILRKMVRVKNTYKITSIADFISLRYNKSMSIAALVTVIAIVGLVPYIALQLKAMISAIKILTQTPDSGGTPWDGVNTGIIFAVFFILFTIVVGVRRLVPTERHQGMVVAVAVESVVKLAALLALGFFVTYSMYGGFGDLFRCFLDSPLSKPITEEQTHSSFYLTWTTCLLLSMSAFMFLPRQFHVAVVENFHEKHIRTAMWLTPLYMLLITIFFLPIAMAGLLAGHSVAEADSFVLLLPLSSGPAWLSLLVFLGGFSAVTGMIMICSMTISTMFTNHLLLPVIEMTKSLRFLKQYLLQCRWIVVAMLILASYWFERHVGVYFTLVDIGLISFAAVLQFAPAIVGGLFWEKGNRAGALLGMGVGILLWFYTLIVPAFVRGGLLSQVLLENGPWGIALLNPEHLFGITGFDSISHAVLWTMLFNIGLYFLGSLYVEQDDKEQDLANEFVNILSVSISPVRLTREPTIDQIAKQEKIKALFGQYFPADKSAEATEQCFSVLNLPDKNRISIVDLAELYSETEKHLASFIGAAAAHQAVRKSEIITHPEENALKQVYSEIIAGLKVTPSDLTRKIDYYREKEELLTRQAAELEEKIKERDKEILERKRAEEALRDSEQRLTDIIDFLPDPTFAIDLEGRIIIWNRAAEEFTGVKAEDMLGKGDYEYAIPFHGVRRPILIDLMFSPVEDIDELYSNYKRANGIITGEAFTRSAKRGEVYLIGTVAPLYDSEGKMIAAIESIRDITEHKQAEEELMKFREHLEQLVEEKTAELAALYTIHSHLTETLDIAVILPTIAQHVMLVLKADRCTVFIFNEKTETLQAQAAHGYMAERFSNFSYRPGEEIVGQAYQQGTIQYVPDIYQVPALPRRDEIRSVLAVPLISPTANPLGVLSVASLRAAAFTANQQELMATLSGQIARAIENARLYHAAQEADRIKSAFLASMSHELRTPLNSIIGFTGILLQGLVGPLSEEQNKQLNMVRNSARHLLALINDVLDISKIEAGQLEIELEPVDMCASIEKAVQTVLPMAEKKGLSLRAEIAPEVNQIIGDRRRVEQVLLNLINNGMKFTETGEVRITCEAHADYVVTRVIDTGIGIKPEDLDTLFKPFRQIDTGLSRQHEGTGLGLSICRKLVDMMGGTISVESEWGTGSTFTFTLPIKED